MDIDDSYTLRIRHWWSQIGKINSSFKLLILKYNIPWLWLSMWLWISTSHTNQLSFPFSLRKSCIVYTKFSIYRPMVQFKHFLDSSSSSHQFNFNSLSKAFPPKSKKRKVKSNWFVKYYTKKKNFWTTEIVYLSIYL